MLNGEPVISIGGQNYSSASNTIILPLNRGDQVWLQLYRGQLVELTDSWSSGAGYVKPLTSTYILFLPPPAFKIFTKCSFYAIILTLLILSN